MYIIGQHIYVLIVVLSLSRSHQLSALSIILRPFISNASKTMASNEERKQFEKMIHIKKVK